MDSRMAPALALLWLREDRRPFALGGDWLGLDGITVLGSEPVRVADARCDPFTLLDEQPEIGSAEAVIGGGWVGWLGYRLGARIEQLPPGPPPAVARPAFSLAFYDHVVVHDGERWWFEALWSAGRSDALRERLGVWQTRLHEPPAPRNRLTPTEFQLAGNGAAGHLAAVTDCRRRIAEGELYQANLCLRLQARFDGDPVDVLAHALARARPRFGALVDGVVSLSPERFISRRGKSVQTEPIKGTRPRTGGPRAQLAEREALERSAKDAAEHVMIVDLMRNDLGRVCAYGTVVAESPRVEPHAGVWQMVSTVSGELRDGVGNSELLRATFPPGSVTGAPKIQAMKVIAALEATRREAYTGAIGIASPIGGLDLSVAIRSFEISRGAIWLGVGGGIVADSEPAAELAEALTKAAGPIAAIGGRLAKPATAGPLRRIGSAPEAALRYGQRPDPARGVFETVLAERGRPVRLREHLGRLAASLDELYGALLPSDIEEQASAVAASEQGRSRLRILADSNGAVTITRSPAPEPEPEPGPEAEPEPARPRTPVLLTPFTLPGGLGAHKWRDRDLVEALARRAPGTVALLVDSDGLVLEAAYANIWIVERSDLVTPPADGRILPGVTRAALLSGEPGAREEPIDLARLQRADAIFLTSSISGRCPALLPTRP
jgi:para-aminobenzoate synthetase / 4-amino-4-deoxychorismate lyase